MDSLMVTKIGSALIFVAPGSFLLYCFLHDDPKTHGLKILKWIAVGFSIVSIILGFKLLTS